MSLADELFICLIAMFWRLEAEWQTLTIEQDEVEATMRDGVNQKRRPFINSNEEYYLYTQRKSIPNTIWLTQEVTS